MLKLGKTRPDAAYQQAHRPLSELLPWMAFISKQMVLGKDGSLLAVFEYDGFDSEGIDALEINTLAERIETATAMLDPGCTVWWTTQRRAINPCMDSSEMNNPGSQFVEDRWQQELRRVTAYTHRNFVAIAFPVETGTGRFFNLYARAVSDGMRSFQALIKAGAVALQSKRRLMFDAEEMIRMIQHAESMLDQFAGSLDALGLRRLSGKALAGMLHRSISPTSRQETIAVDYETSYLDTLLGDQPITVHARHLRFGGANVRHSATASIKAWPNTTQPGIFNVVQRIDAELDFTIAFRVLGKEEARRYIEDIRRHNANFSKSILGYFREAMSQGNAEATVDNTRLVQFEDADEALTDLGAGGSAGFMLATLTVFGTGEKDVDLRFGQAMKTLNAAEFVFMRETIHQLSAWTGHIPGQTQEPVRWMLVSGHNYADCLPVRFVRTGSAHNAYLTQQRGKPTPALTTFQTDDRIPFFFHWHGSDLPHAIVIGPSRAGKSVLMMFLASQFNRYAPSQVFIFDKDLTCRIPTYMHDGQYLWLNKEDAPLNPLRRIESAEDMRWFANWVELLIESRGYSVTAEDEKEIWQTIKQVMEAKRSGVNVSLSSFAIQLKSHLAEQLNSWVGEGQRSALFDNQEDALSFSDWTAMEMGMLYEDPRAARAFMDYAFHRIYQRLDGRPTMIYVEEAWFMLEDARFANKVNDWLRTLAKKNALLVLTTQSLDELSKSTAFVSMVDNIPNRIFLSNPNARASLELYMKKFGLRAAQVERIRTAVPKKQYYVCTPEGSRMVEARFPPEVLSFIRSDGKAQKVFDAARKEHPDNWKEVYSHAMQKEH